MQISILVVEDEQPIRELLKYNLEKEGYAVTTCESGEDALSSLKQSKPNLVLLDLMLPGINGLEICKLITEDSHASRPQVVMLSALGEESDIISGLEMGAADYISKPFSPRLLLARIRAVIGRKTSTPKDYLDDITIHGISIFPRRAEVSISGVTIDLTATEFKVLNFLAHHPAWVFTRDQIVDAVKGVDYPVTARSVDVQIVGLRKKLGDYGSIIETVRGIGYRVRE